MSYEGRDLVRAFFFGVRLAEHYHDIPYPLDKEQPDRFVHLLKTIAEGDFTLVDTPEELEDQTDWHPVLREKLPDMLRAARTHHRRIAGELLEVLVNLPGSPWQS
jgi:hypothetical protein